MRKAGPNSLASVLLWGTLFYQRLPALLLLGWLFELCSWEIFENPWFREDDVSQFQ